MLKHVTMSSALLTALVGTDAIAVCWTERLDPKVGESAQSSTSSVPENNVGEYLYDATSGAMYLVDSWYDPNSDVLFADSDLVEYQSDEDFAGGSSSLLADDPKSGAQTINCFDPNPRGTPMPRVSTTGRMPSGMRLPPAGLAYFYRIAGSVGSGRNVVPSIRAAAPSPKTCADDVDERLEAAVGIANRTGQWNLGRAGHDYVVTNADGSTDTWTFNCRCAGTLITLVREPRIPCTPPPGG